MYEAVTRSIRVRVTPAYLQERSTPDDGYYFWAYTVDIVNESGDPVQLRARHWRIIDAGGRAEEVHGPGVVGQTPLIPPTIRWPMARVACLISQSQRFRSIARMPSVA
jgi:ApaG protein